MRVIEQNTTIQKNRIYQMDCLDGMKLILDKSIDMILCDLPYGTTKCKWDMIIPLELLWEQYKRIIKDNGVIVLTASQPFTTTLVSSNLEWFKYCWVWEKTKAANFIQAKNMPLKLHEDICVFSNGAVIHKGQSKRRMTYNPQGVKEVYKKWTRPRVYDSEHQFKRPSHKNSRNITQEGYPSSVLKFNSVHNPPHPTQKPVGLFEYLIKTYTNEGDTVLDNCMGSGTTAVACENLNREWIGFETESKYIEIANNRLRELIKSSS
ncbi:DNA-methyltransferase [Bacillus velezensis]|uniref:DNA-methyltransferase n=2 Tax=Bacillus velezensis TaxID=492670 RepID=UPI000A3F37D1